MKASILLVEDDPDQLEVRRLILEHAGYEVLTAGNAAQALRHASDCRLVVMDLITGNEDVAAGLPGDAELIVLSGREPSAFVRARAAAVLPKPFPSHNLLAAIARLWTSQSK